MDIRRLEGLRIDCAIAFSASLYGLNGNRRDSVVVGSDFEADGEPWRTEAIVNTLGSFELGGY